MLATAAITKRSAIALISAAVRLVEVTAAAWQCIRSIFLSCSLKGLTSLWSRRLSRAEGCEKCRWLFSGRWRWTTNSSHVPYAMGHYIENTGDTPHQRLLENVQEQLLCWLIAESMARVTAFWTRAGPHEIRSEADASAKREASGRAGLERIHLCAYPILALQGAGQGDRLARERYASSTSTSSLRNSPAVNIYSDRHASPYAMIKAIDDAHYSSILAVHAAAMLCGAWAAPPWDTSSTAATIERASVHLAG